MANDKYADCAMRVGEAMGSPTLAAELIKEHSATRIADYLNAERIRQGLSQRDIARRTGLSASKICRIEDSYDQDLNYADIAKYARALSVELKVVFEPSNADKKRRSEWLIYQIDALLNRLKSSVSDAEGLQKAIDEFSGRTLFPILRLCHQVD